MRINITKKLWRLEDISKGDLLVFHDREETVEQINAHTGSLLTKRIVESQDRNSPFIEQLILYTHIQGVIPSLRGHTYEGIKQKTI